MRPSESDVNKALSLIAKRPANHEYFFRRLDSPDWIDPLVEKGLFQSPPNALREGDRVSFPPWPESEYLARMAMKAPEVVHSVMMSMPETDNVRVHDDLCKAAIQLPVELASIWAEREAAWIATQDSLYFLLPQSIGALTAALADGGQVEQAIVLAAAAISTNGQDGENIEARIRMDAWEYGEFLTEYFVAAIRAAPIESLGLLCGTLQDVLLEGEDKSEDYSWIWRPAIESDSQNHGHSDIRDHLIDSIRNGAEWWLGNGGDLEALVRDLLRRPGSVFQRLGLHLAATDSSSSIARELICNEGLFADRRLYHEYFRLLWKGFPMLEEWEKERILSWIEAGPEVSPEGEGERTERENVQRAHWQACRLSGLYESLPEPWRQVYDEYVEVKGEPDHPEFLRWSSSGFVGPRSPINLEDLAELPIGEVAEYLRSWEPSDAWDAPSPEGLGRIVEVFAEKSHREIARSIELFAGLESTYCRAITQGFESALKNGSELLWEPILPFLDWVVQQGESETVQERRLSDRDPHWGWARRAVVSLLSTGCGSSGIPIAMREQVWRVIAAVTSDPDPDVSRDAGAMHDAVSLSINSVRGEAMHGVVRYALWVYRDHQQSLVGEGEADFSIEFLPEVRECLRVHLMPESDSSPAIRSVYGQWFPHFVLLDREWAIDLVEQIFEPMGDPPCHVAWSSYISGCPVYDDVFQALSGQYQSAIERLGPHGDEVGRRGSHDGERLGQHLLVLVGRGVLTWDGVDGLVRTFFEKASIADAAGSLAFVGRSLNNESQVLDGEVIERFRSLWDSLETAFDGRSDEEWLALRPIGWWFSSGKFPPEWAIMALRRVIEESGGVDPIHLVLEQLAITCSDWPDEAIAVLAALARTSKAGEIYWGSRGSVMQLLEEALKHDSSMRDATNLIHYLGARGLDQYRTLLSGEVT